jgi:hypothetical protein
METPEPYTKRSQRSLVLLLILVIGFALYHRETIEFYTYYRFVCLADAVDVGDGKKLGVCGRDVIDNGGSFPLI